ncbi:pre-peptidase C-terminal domain-containing protein [Flavobacterium dankookense]|nr:pre-peptidase C-terminal domain-containing protein [Flavobacterium dankookense]
MKKHSRFLNHLLFFGLLLFYSVCFSQTSCSTALPITLNGTCGAINASDTSPNAPNVGVNCPGTFNRESWFTFTLATGPQNIVIRGTSTNNNRNLYLQLINGTCGGTLSELACANTVNNNSAQTEIIEYNSLPAGTYFIKASNVGNAGNINISSLCVSTPPSNNNCSGATNLTVNPTATCTTNSSGTTINATQSQTGCLGAADDDVWYSFVATSTAHTITVTPGSLSDAVLEVFSGSCGSLTSVSCVDGTFSGAETIALSGLTPSTTYFVRVYSFGNSTGQGTFSVCVTTPPNPCSSITTITACNTPISVTIPAGTGTYSTSACGFTTPGNELIYSFTPTVTGLYTINQTSSFTFIDYQYKLASLGCSATGWTCIDDIFGASSSLGFTLTAGTQYFFLLDPESNTGGSVSFSITCPIPPPINDNCLGAISLTPTGSVCTYATYSTSGATASIETAPGCASYSGGDVWFSAVVPANGILLIDTIQGVVTDGGVAAYRGVCGSLILIECDDDDSANGAMPFLRLINQTPGSTIYIRFWEYGNDNNGTFGICVTTPNPPINDNPCSAIDLNTNTTCSFQSFTTLAATASPGVPAPGCASYTSGDVWFTTTVPANGIVRIDTQIGQVLDGGLAVYSGTCTGLTLIQCDNDSSVNGAMPYLNLTGQTPGNILYIRFWETNNDNPGTFGICLSTPCTPGNGQGNTTAGCPVIVTGGLGLIGADPDPLDACNASSCVELEASYLVVGETTSYSVEQINYNPPPYNFECLANPVSVNIDDVWSPIVNLPFNFCFYGNTYNSCLVGSNGMITFNTGTPGGATGYSFSNNLPSTVGALFANTIYGVYHDIDPSKGGEVGWELITLDTGCRALVAAWSNVPMFRTNSILYSGMIVLYENTNIIEVYVKEKNIEFNGSTNWNDGNAIIGLQNAAGTLATVAPGRNGLDTNWATSNEAWRFTPSGNTLTSITWYEGAGITGPAIGTTDVLSVCPTTTTTYTAQVTYNLCTGGTITELDQTTVTVNPDKVWNGSVDFDWNKPNNWIPVGIPNGSDCVTIPNTVNDPIISGTNYNGLAGTLTIHNNAILTVNSNNSITVTDFVDVNTGGTFLINNDASLVQINNVTNTGNITYKREANIRTLDYVYWSSPVFNQVFSGITSPIVSGPIYQWNPTIDNPNNTQGNWTVPSTTTMTRGKGYIIRGPSTSGFNNTTPNILVGTFTGVANNGDIFTQISRGDDENPLPHFGANGIEISNFSDNWNLIGNPYPSSIRASQFLFNNRTKILGNVRLWTHGNLPIYNTNPFYDSFGYNYTPGDYLTYTFTGTSCCPAAEDDLFIGAGQGFMVQMLDGPEGSDVVAFNNGLRNASYPNDYFFRFENPTQNNDINVNVNQLEKNRIWLDIINSTNKSERTLFGYIEGATNNLDHFYDCLTQNIGLMTIYTLSNNDKYLIQGKELPFDENDVVPIGIVIQTAGNHTIAIAGVDGIFNSHEIYLRDNLLNTVHDIKANPYQFYSSNGMFNNRFEIIYRNSTLSIGEISSKNEVIVFTKNEINIVSNEVIDSIEVFNILGQKIEAINNIDRENVIINSIAKSNTSLLLKIKLENGIIVTKKVIY